MATFASVGDYVAALSGPQRAITDHADIDPDLFASWLRQARDLETGAGPPH